MRKYTVVVTDDEKGNTIRLDRENQGFTGIDYDQSAMDRMNKLMLACNETPQNKRQICFY